MNIINFWSNKGNYGFLSNFYFVNFWYDGRRWKTSEHAFQAMKFFGTKYEEVIRNQPTPALAAKNGKRRDFPLRDDWENIKDELMKEIVMAKFKQNEDIKIMLLDTKNAKLVEDSPYDYYWGCGKNKTGKNKLGKILMEIRKCL